MTLPLPHTLTLRVGVCGVSVLCYRVCVSPTHSLPLTRSLPLTLPLTSTLCVCMCVCVCPTPLHTLCVRVSVCVGVTRVRVSPAIHPTLYTATPPLLCSVYDRLGGKLSCVLALLPFIREALRDQLVMAIANCQGHSPRQ